jgi:predicted O-methyltransferase YrrM
MNNNFDSNKFWDKRYKTGGNSGKGSYSNFATFKGNIVNSVIMNNSDIKTIVDYGVGDGNQLTYFNLENINYIGLDVSEFIINKCKKIYNNDIHKQFLICDKINFNNLKCDLVLSLDVLYHLIEDHEFIGYLNNLFKISNKFVIIYANNIDKTHTAEHVKFRNFTNYIKQNFKEWILIKHIINPYKNESPSDFYIFEKNEIINNWKLYINKNLIQMIGNTPEGNIYTSHLSNKEEDLMIPKQKNIVNLIQKIKPEQVLEIGFNAGFSAVLMKMSFPCLNLTCVDINYHDYVEKCFNKISSDFSDINILLESSSIALNNLINNKKYYDIIHIDGDHSLNGATNDLNLCLKLSKKGTIIIFDDTNISSLNNLCESYIKKGLVSEYNEFNKVECAKYQHKFLKVI